MDNNKLDQLLEAAQCAHFTLVAGGLATQQEQHAADALADAILAYDMPPRMPLTSDIEHKEIREIVWKRFDEHFKRRIELRQQWSAELAHKLDQLEAELSAPLPEPPADETPAWLIDLDNQVMP